MFSGMKSSQICFGTLGTMLEADPSAFPLIDRAMSSQIWKKKRVFAHFPATPICNGDLQPLCRDGFILALLEASWRLTSICYDPFHCFECERPFPRMRCFTDPR